jgi:hypothetical protein
LIKPSSRRRDHHCDNENDRHIDIRYAIGASIVSVIITSSGAAVAYAPKGMTKFARGEDLGLLQQQRAQSAVRTSPGASPAGVLCSPLSAPHAHSREPMCTVAFSSVASGAEGCRFDSCRER